MLPGLQASSVRDRSTQLAPEQPIREDTIAFRNSDVFDKGPFSITVSVLCTTIRQQYSTGLLEGKAPCRSGGGGGDIRASNTQAVVNWQTEPER